MGLLDKGRRASLLDRQRGNRRACARRESRALDCVRRPTFMIRVMVVVVGPAGLVVSILARFRGHFSLHHRLSRDWTANSVLRVVSLRSAMETRSI